MLEKSQKPHKKTVLFNRTPPPPPPPSSLCFYHFPLIPPPLTLVAGRDGGKGGKAENSFIRTEITTTWREPEATHTHTCTDTHTPSHVEDTSWPNHTCLRDVLKRDRLMNTDGWGRVKRNIKSTTWDFIFLCCQLSNMLQRDSDQDWQLLHCQVYLHHSIYCTNYQLHPPTLWHPVCTPRDSLAATTTSGWGTHCHRSCVCVFVCQRGLAGLRGATGLHMQQKLCVITEDWHSEPRGQVPIQEKEAN